MIKRHARANVFVVAALVLPISISVVRADDPAPPHRDRKEAERIKPGLVTGGNGWWCRDGEEGACWRDRDDCDVTASGMESSVPCVPRRTTWAMTYFVRAGTGTTGHWYAGVFATRSNCAEHREDLVARDDSSSISPCTEMRESRRRRARGKGWWCYRFTHVGAEGSHCSRTKSACRAARADKGSCTAPCLGSAVAATPCQAETEAWLHPSNDAVHFATEAHCYSDWREIGEACTAVP